MPRLAAALLALALPAVAETRSGLVLKPFAEDKTAEITVEIDQYLDSETDRGEDFGMRVAYAAGRARVLPKLARRSPVIGFEALYIDLDTEDLRLPDRLVETSLAIGAGRPFGDWILQGTIGAGFAGDRPYSGPGWFGLASLSGTRILGRGHFLTLGLDFDGNRPIFPDVPLPVVLWTRSWSEQFSTSIGFPFLAFTWLPTDWLELNFRGIPGVFQTGSIVLRPEAQWEIFARYRGANFRFFVEEFDNDNDRIFYGEDRVELGVRWLPTEDIEVTGFGGFSFNREFSSGFDVRDTETVARVDDGWVFGLSVTIRF